MMPNELQKLLERVVHEQHSITTDWLAYCLLKSVKYEVLEEKNVVLTKSIKTGVPAVGTLILIDNDFYQCQDDSWKEQFKIICRTGFTIYLKIIDDVSFADENNVSIKETHIVVAFQDPEDSIR
ncbi:MAG: hypothetical protein Q7R33_06100 [Nitrosarchaeum sp.]|nr:hypothetical protein [Nitrosarchaeum sp.]